MRFTLRLYNFKKKFVVLSKNFQLLKIRIMLEKINHFPINWIDGMKINKSHLLALQDYFADVYRDSVGSRITPISYGLLPNEDHESARIYINQDNHNLLTVRVEECHAVTSNGTRIEINPVTELSEKILPETIYTLQNSGETVLWITIVVSLFEKLPFGKINAEENPPRYPFLMPAYKIVLIKDGEKSVYPQGYQLTIGKILVGKDSAHLQENYIPPCTAVQSHKTLITAYSEFDRFLGQIEQSAVQIVQKINQKQQSNNLAVMIGQMCELIMSYLGNEINSLRWFGLYEPPAFMLDKIARLARIIKNFVDVRVGAGKEELLNYLAEWCGLSQGDFEILFSEVVNAGYNHNEIGLTLKKSATFIKTLEGLFATLSKLDYIGKRNDTGIFIKERQENDPTKKIKRSIFFDD